MTRTPKTVSVDEQGTEDGFVPAAGYYAEADRAGATRLVVSVPIERLEQVHADLVRAMAAPLGWLYRQHVDRRSPRPEGSPPRDLVALELPVETALDALRDAGDLVYGDGRCEVWIRGRLGEQVILDVDGVVYCYPDDPAFRDVLRRHGVPEGRIATMAERDYVKRWYHAENDALEDALLQRLHLSEVPRRG